EIVEMRGTQSGPEGCLSVPGVFGWVRRPQFVKVKAQDREGKEFEVEGEGLTARAFCHEIDHLNGILFDSVADHIMTDEELDEYYGRKR
ncbi:MAG: peptide deformylase, partial [Oscillospiraceae bacterium]|nr:peptide deformylase [Oscillospiraceae bacterium]